ncbi:MAG TPA: hypothetical protein VGO62_19880, partial [Myxococcota bacterium]
DVVLLLAAAATPAIGAFLGGASTIAFVVDNPRAEDWATVAGCSVVGCLAVGAVVAGVGGFDIGCGTGLCAPVAPTVSNDLLWATGGAGLGTALGLGVGALAGLVSAPQTSEANSGLILGAAIGSLVGGAVGGGIGGAIAGGLIDEHENDERPPPPRHPRRPAYIR